MFSVNGTGMPLIKKNRDKEANLLCVHNVSAICAHGRDQRLERYGFELV